MSPVTKAASSVNAVSRLSLSRWPVSLSLRLFVSGLWVINRLLLTVNVFVITLQAADSGGLRTLRTHWDDHFKIK